MVKPRRLLLVSYYFPPCSAVAAFRMLGLTRHLPKFGWQVSVVAPPRMPHEPFDAAAAEQVPPTTVVHAVPYTQGWWSRRLQRYVRHQIWLPRAYAACQRAIRREKPDAVLTSSPPPCVHLLGLVLKKQFRLPWLADFRDPWVTNNESRRQRLFRTSWESLCEATVARQADCVIANTPSSCRGYQAAFASQRHKFVAIPNGYDPESFVDLASAPSTDESVTILHAGELYSGRDPRPLFDALGALLRDRPSSPKQPFRLLLLGHATENRFDLAQAIRERGLDQVVEFGGHVPYAQALQAMKQADILLVLDTAGRKVSIPAKLYEYLGAGRPILALSEPDGDVAWALLTSGVVHRVAPPNDAQRIKQALLELDSELRAQPHAGALNGRASIFTRERMAGTVAECLNRLVAGRATANGNRRVFAGVNGSLHGHVPQRNTDTSLPHCPPHARA